MDLMNGTLYNILILWHILAITVKLARGMNSPHWRQQGNELEIPQYTTTMVNEYDALENFDGSTFESRPQLENVLLQQSIAEQLAAVSPLPSVRTVNTIELRQDARNQLQDEILRRINQNDLANMPHTIQSPPVTPRALHGSPNKSKKRGQRVSSLTQDSQMHGMDTDRDTFIAANGNENLTPRQEALQGSQSSTMGLLLDGTQYKKKRKKKKSKKSANLAGSGSGLSFLDTSYSETQESRSPLRSPNQFCGVIEKPSFESNLVVQDDDSKMPFYDLQTACDNLRITNIQCSTVNRGNRYVNHINRANAAESLSSDKSLQSSEVSNDVNLLSITEIIETDLYSQLMSELQIIIKTMGNSIEMCDQYNEWLTHYAQTETSLISDLPNLPHPMLVNKPSFNPLPFFVEQIHAWKHIYIHLFSNYLNVTVDTIKTGCHCTMIVAQKNETLRTNELDQIIRVTLQYDAINYIFRRFLHLLASQRDRYNRLESFMVKEGLMHGDPNIFTTLSDINTQMINYFSQQSYKDKLSKYAYWIRKAFENCIFYDSEWWNIEIVKRRYANILEIDAKMLDEWIVYVAVFDRASKKPYSNSQIQKVFRRSSSVGTVSESIFSPPRLQWTDSSESGGSSSFFSNPLAGHVNMDLLVMESNDSDGENNDNDGNDFGGIATGAAQPPPNNQKPATKSASVSQGCCCCM